MGFASTWDDLEAALAAISGLRTSDGIPDRVNPPHAIVEPAGVDYHESFDGSVTYRYRVTVLVSRAASRAGWKALDDYVEPSGAKSIVAAIETVSGATVTEAGPPGQITVADVDYLAVTFSCEVLA